MAANRGKLSVTVPEWTIKEQLVLASAVQRSGDQNWVSVSRSVKPLVEEVRPVDYFSQKNCVQQYASMLDKVTTPHKRKKRASEGGSEETSEQQIVRQLTEKQINQLNKSLSEIKKEYLSLMKDVELIEKGELDHKIPEIWEQIFADESPRKEETTLKQMGDAGVSPLKSKATLSAKDIVKCQEQLKLHQIIVSHPHPSDISTSGTTHSETTQPTSGGGEHASSVKDSNQLILKDDVKAETDLTPSSVVQPPDRNVDFEVTVKKELPSTSPTLMDIESHFPRFMNFSNEKSLSPMQTPQPSTDHPLSADIHIIVQQRNNAVDSMAANICEESRLSVTPTLSAMSVTPTLSAMSVTPTLSTMSVTPTLSTMSVTPTLSAMSVTPTLSTMSVTPTLSAMSVTPTLSTMSVTPTLSTMNVTPTLSTMSVTPTLSTMSVIPNLSTMSVTPTLSTMSVIPNLSTMSVTPTLSTMSVTPTLSTMSVIPNLSTMSVTPTLSTMSVIPNLSTMSVTPTWSTMSVIPNLSTMSVIPNLSTMNVIPNLSTMSVIPNLSTMNVAPTLSTMSAIPNLSTMSVIPNLSTMSVTPTLSTISVTPTLSTLSMTPTLSAMSMTPTLSTMNGTPALSARMSVTPTLSALSGTPTLPAMSGTITVQTNSISQPIPQSVLGPPFSILASTTTTSKPSSNSPLVFSINSTKQIVESGMRPVPVSIPISSTCLISQPIALTTQSSSPSLSVPIKSSPSQAQMSSAVTQSFPSPLPVSSAVTQSFPSSLPVSSAVTQSFPSPLPVSIVFSHLKSNTHVTASVSKSEPSKSTTAKLRLLSPTYTKTVSQLLQASSQKDTANVPIPAAANLSRAIYDNKPVVACTPQSHSITPVKSVLQTLISSSGQGSLRGTSDVQPQSPAKVFTQQFTSTPLAVYVPSLSNVQAPVSAVSVTTIAPAQGGLSKLHSETTTNISLPSSTPYNVQLSETITPTLSSAPSAMPITRIRQILTPPVASKAPSPLVIVSQTKYEAQKSPLKSIKSIIAKELEPPISKVIKTDSMITQALYEVKVEATTVQSTVSDGSHDAIVSKASDDVIVTKASEESTASKASDKAIVIEGSDDATVSKGSNDATVTEGRDSVPSETGESAILSKVEYGKAIVAQVSRSPSNLAILEATVETNSSASCTKPELETANHSMESESDQSKEIQKLFKNITVTKELEAVCYPAVETSDSNEELKNVPVSCTEEATSDVEVENNEKITPVTSLKQQPDLTPEVSSTPVSSPPSPPDSGSVVETLEGETEEDTPSRLKKGQRSILRRSLLTRATKKKVDDEGPSVESTDTEEDGFSSQATSAVPSPAPSQCEMDVDTLRAHKQWKKGIMIVWRHAAQHKYANFFLHPVREEDAPGYKDVILWPADLSSIKRKVESGIIKNDIEFQRDMLLMFQNAFMYNSSDHEVYQIALDMKSDVMENLQTYLATQAQLQLVEEPTPSKSLRGRRGDRDQSLDESLFSPATKKRRTRADD